MSSSSFVFIKRKKDNKNLDKLLTLMKFIAGVSKNQKLCFKNGYSYVSSSGIESFLKRKWYGESKNETEEKIEYCINEGFKYLEKDDIDDNDKKEICENLISMIPAIENIKDVYEEYIEIDIKLSALIKKIKDNIIKEN